MPEDSSQPFQTHGPNIPVTPVILSVPHAGRNYPDSFLRASRLSRKQLELLEDRYADQLITQAIANGHSAIVATRARAWIDLNRHEREIDPEMVDPRPPSEGLIRSSKVAGGLGLMPRRLRGSGDILRTRVSAACLQSRIEEDHRPYHMELGKLLRATRQRFGTAILLDIHSMPPLASGVSLVIGDLFGRSANTRHAWLARDITEAHGFSVAMNNPYAGGHILSSHGRPARGIHALQIEIDRSLYLENDLSTLRPDLGGVDSLIAHIADGLVREIGKHDITAIAAE